MLVRVEIDGKVLMICGKCKTESCFHHGNAHSGSLCDEYQKEKQDDEKMQCFLATFTNKCPSCGVNTERNGGCNRMVSIYRNNSYLSINLLFLHSYNVFVRLALHSMW